MQLVWCTSALWFSNCLFIWSRIPPSGRGIAHERVMGARGVAFTKQHIVSAPSIWAPFFLSTVASSSFYVYSVFNLLAMFVWITFVFQFSRAAFLRDLRGLVCV